MKLRSPRRPGFTLLEVLLASLIAILLLTGLYFAMDVTLRQTQESRDGVVVDGMARDVFNRVGIDLASTLGPLPPKSGGNSAASAGSSASSTTTTTTTTNDPTAVVATGAGTVAPAPDAGATTTTTATTTDPSTASAAPQAAPPQFQAGVVGEDWYMTAFVSRVPGVLADPRGLSQPPDPNAATPSDLWRVTYWRRDDGRLCRQVRPWVTADDVSDPTSIDRGNEDGDTLADEITNVTFEYYGDPTGSTSPDWQQTWDGTTPGPDGVTPVGPPRAVRLTLTFSIPSSRPGGQPLEQTVSQVIPVRTAPGPNTPPLIEPSTDPGTVTPDNSGSGMDNSGSNGSNTTAGAGGGAAGGAKSSGGAASGGAKSSGSTGGAGSGAKSSGTPSAAPSAPRSTTPAAPSAPKSTTPAAPSAPRSTAPAASSAPRSSGSAMPAPAAPSTGGGGRGGTGGGGTGGGGGGTGGGGTGGGGAGGGGTGGGGRGGGR